MKRKAQKAKIIKLESAMKWKCTPGTIKPINERWLDHMGAALNAASESGLDITHHTMGK